jgi:cardiolipin synthase
VTIVTPYYVPDDPMQLALVLAARRGLRVELVVPV